MQTASWASRCSVVALVGIVVWGLFQGGSGCLVKSHCQADYDCAADERCQLGSGECFVECSTDQDCRVNGLDIGRQCLSHRCEFLFDQRVPAPSFCLEVANPKSEYHGRSLCIDELKGKVVLLFFGLLA
jgi:hypothetical protein